MNRFRQKVAAIMHSRSPQPPLSLATALRAGSLIYEKVLLQRQRLFDQGRLTIARLDCPVISIGNITMGGTGKTPMTLYLARLLTDLGYHPLVLSRGYKGAGEKKEMVVCDGRQILSDFRQSGDEPLLMARLLQGGVPVVVGRRRHAAGRMAVERFDPDVILLDDGFQHQQLARNLNILLLDAQAPFGNSYLLPRGSLREPVSAAARADVVVLTRCKDQKPRALHHIEGLAGSVPVFRTDHRVVFRGVVPAGEKLGSFQWHRTQRDSPAVMSGKKVVAFSGLARNRQFWRTIPELGGRLADTVGFEDHHAYRPTDVQRLSRIARSTDCDCLVTTDKDLVRLPVESTLPRDLMVLGVVIDFAGEEDRWRQTMTDRLAAISDKFKP